MQTKQDVPATPAEARLVEAETLRLQVATARPDAEVALRYEVAKVLASL